MNNFSKISNLKQLQQEKQLLQKKARRQENLILNDIGSLQDSVRKWANGVLRVKNILTFFLPKVELVTVLSPVLKRLFRKRKK